MNLERMVIAEGFTNIIAGAGLWYYLVSILINRTSSTLERRFSLMLGVVGGLFLLRGISYTAGLNESLSPYVFVLSVLFPLVSILFVEALLRRHVPLTLKILSAVSTAVLVPLALAETRTHAFYVALLSYQGIALIWLSYLTIKRDKQSLSEAENRVINGVAMACSISIPLLISDYRIIFDWHVMRLGALGGLIFCLSMIKFSEKSTKREVSRELFHIALMDVIGTTLYCLVWNDFESFGIAFPVFMTMHVLILIFKELGQLRETRMQEWIFPVVEAIEKNQVHSVSDLHQLLTLQLGKTSLTFLSEDAMADYDVKLIKEFLIAHKNLTLSHLRKENSPAAVQLTYALDSMQMNQVHVINIDPLLMIFTNTPAYKGAAAYEKEIQILKSFIALLQRKSA